VEVIVDRANARADAPEHGRRLAEAAARLGDWIRTLPPPGPR
jgi:hypothetical protein